MIDDIIINLFSDKAEEKGNNFNDIYLYINRRQRKYF